MTDFGIDHKNNTLKTSDSTFDITFDFAWENPQWQPWQDHLEPLICQLGELVLNTLYPHHGPGEVSWAFVDNPSIQTLNSEYRHQDKPTNVLSFGYITDPCELNDWHVHTCLGDVILAFDVIEDEAKAQNKSFIQHCIHLCIHGLLHLLGYDHQNDIDAESMEDLEIRFLQSFNIPNPYEYEEDSSL